MSDKYGLLIAEDGQTIQNYRNKVDSRRRTLIVDLEIEQPHMQIVEVSGGNSYTDDGALFGRAQDLLYSFSHKLGYTPLVDCYFYVKTYDKNTTDSKVGGYGDSAYLISGSAGTLADVVTFEADAQNFKLVHNFDAYGFASGYVSPAPKFLFKVKFYIYSIDIGRAVNYGYPFDGTGIIIP